MMNEYITSLSTLRIAEDLLEEVLRKTCISVNALLWKWNNDYGRATQKTNCRKTN